MPVINPPIVPSIRIAYKMSQCSPRRSSENTHCWDYSICVPRTDCELLPLVLKIISGIVNPYGGTCGEDRIYFMRAVRKV